MTTRLQYGLEPSQGQRHDRAERVTHQDVHRLRYLGENVPSEIINRQTCGVSGVP